MLVFMSWKRFTVFCVKINRSWGKKTTWRREQKQLNQKSCCYSHVILWPKCINPYIFFLGSSNKMCTKWQNSTQTDRFFTGSNLCAYMSFDLFGFLDFFGAICKEILLECFFYFRLLNITWLTGFQQFIVEIFRLFFLQFYTFWIHNRLYEYRIPFAKAIFSRFAHIFINFH